MPSWFTDRGAATTHIERLVGSAWDVHPPRTEWAPGSHRSRPEHQLADPNPRLTRLGTGLRFVSGEEQSPSHGSRSLAGGHIGCVSRSARGAGARGMASLTPGTPEAGYVRA
jgi:hypothetical protein